MTGTTGSTRRIYTWALIAYLLVSAGLAVYYFSIGSYYFMAQSLGTMAMPLVFQLVYRLVRVKPTPLLQLIILAYTFMAYTLGVALEVYHIVYGFDKVMHCLSGTLTMALALPVFYMLKPGHSIEAHDFPLAVVFCIAVTVAVAGVWEMAEFGLNLVTGMDVQNVAVTGVSDTMTDMIICTVGAIPLVPLMYSFYCKGKENVLSRTVNEFIAANASR